MIIIILIVYENEMKIYINNIRGDETEIGIGVKNINLEEKTAVIPFVKSTWEFKLIKITLLLDITLSEI